MNNIKWLDDEISKVNREAKDINEQIDALTIRREFCWGQRQALESVRERVVAEGVVDELVSTVR